MPLHNSLDDPQILPDNYRNVLKWGDKSKRDEALKRYFNFLCKRDGYMQPGATSKLMYHKAFAQAVQLKLINTLISALDNGSCPEIEITLDDGEQAAANAGYGKFGSRQDFLYSFTSQRSPVWSEAITKMGFKSAVMVGEQRIVVTMAPRFLEMNNPSRQIDELSGAIASDFWETNSYISTIPELYELLHGIYTKYGWALPAQAVNTGTIDAEVASIESKLASVPQGDGYYMILAKMATDALAYVKEPTTASGRSRRYNARMNALRDLMQGDRQEQIALKYVQDGNFLQKLLGGKRVDHIQSNVKNQKNPLRNSGCEVDSIYRVIGEKMIVLVETKTGSLISRTQLYQMYETYRLKLPSDWKVIVVGVLLTRPDATMPSTVRTVIDMAIIKFDDDALGKITESIINMKIGRHYRWLIHQN